MGGAARALLEDDLLVPPMLPFVATPSMSLQSESNVMMETQSILMVAITFVNYLHSSTAGISPDREPSAFPPPKKQVSRVPTTISYQKNS